MEVPKVEQKLETEEETAQRIVKEMSENDTEIIKTDEGKVVLPKYYKEDYIEQGLAEDTLEKSESTFSYEAIPGEGHLQPDAQVYKDIGQKYGIDWRMVSAIHCSETYDRVRNKCTRHTANPVSYAGAKGCMQFMPKTWSGRTASSTGYGVDGDGDGIADINNCMDSLHSAGNYLSASYKKGLELGKNEEQARWYAYRQYNHADFYANTAQDIFNTLK